MHEVLVNRLGGLSLPRKSVVRLTDRPDMTLDVYRGRKTTMQQQQQQQQNLTISGPSSVHFKCLTLESETFQVNASFGSCDTKNLVMRML